MTTKSIYVLKSRWYYDGVNEEYATITIEKGCDVFEGCVDKPMHHLWEELRKIAQVQNGNSISSKLHLIALYKVEGSVEESIISGSGIAELKIRMKLICVFDEDGNPVCV